MGQGLDGLREDQLHGRLQLEVQAREEGRLPSARSIAKTGAHAAAKTAWRAFKVK